ncbi:pI329L [African swine fever virus]|uniref:PI329L n=1 Tax=African swine fever virus TaxID=10497 RepID=A0A894KSH5_ASF|nr:pI329L [African swine fever virus]
MLSSCTCNLFFFCCRYIYNTTVCCGCMFFYNCCLRMSMFFYTTSVRWNVWNIFMARVMARLILFRTGIFFTYTTQQAYVYKQKCYTGAYNTYVHYGVPAFISFRIFLTYQLFYRIVYLGKLCSTIFCLVFQKLMSWFIPAAYKTIQICVIVTTTNSSYEKLRKTLYERLFLFQYEVLYGTISFSTHYIIVLYVRWGVGANMFSVYVIFYVLYIVIPYVQKLVFFTKATCNFRNIFHPAADIADVLQRLYNTCIVLYTYVIFLYIFYVMSSACNAGSIAWYTIICRKNYTTIANTHIVLIPCIIFCYTVFAGVLWFIPTCYATSYKNKKYANPY